MSDQPGGSRSGRSQQGLYRYSKPLKEIGVQAKDLKVGDHIYVLRNPDLRKKGFLLIYKFSHHGIVVKAHPGHTKLHVVHFTKTEQIGGEDGSNDDHTNHSRRRRGSAFSWKTYHCVKYGSLEEFANKDKETGELKYLRYRYGASSALKGMEGTEEDEDDLDNAAEVAKWFAYPGYSHMFGKYQIGQWDSEHFAIFCKTTRLRPEDLPYLPVARYGKQFYFPRKYLEDHSKLIPDSARASPQQGTFRFSKPIDEIGVRAEDLKAGDHIYVLRKPVRACDRLGYTYTYSHHGIVVDVDSKLQVVHFTKSSQRHTDEWNSEDSDVKPVVPQDEDTNKIVLQEQLQSSSWKGQALRRIGARTKKRLSMTPKYWYIGLGHLQWFAHSENETEDEREYRYLRYQYGPEVSLGGREGTPYASGDPKNASDIALWLVKAPHRQLFGDYDIINWNCEHFATFCKTTSLKPNDLKHAPRDLASKSISKEHLKDESHAESWQTRYAPLPPKSPKPDMDHDTSANFYDIHSSA